MKKHFKRILLLCIALGLVAAVVLDFAAYLGATRLKVTSYQVEAEVTQSLRIVHLTDLHSREYGQGNEKLVALVKAQQPDLIFITGDMLTVSDEGPEVVCRLIPKLLEIAPVYYGYGNHEKEWEEETGLLLEQDLTEAGAIVLDCAYTDIELKGQQLRIGGYHGYWRQPHMTSDDWVKIHTELDFCAAFEETDRVKLLLCHIPTAWLDWNYIDKWPGGIVFPATITVARCACRLLAGCMSPMWGGFRSIPRAFLREKRLPAYCPWVPDRRRVYPGFLICRRLW